MEGSLACAGQLTAADGGRQAPGMCSPQILLPLRQGQLLGQLRPPQKRSCADAAGSSDVRRTTPILRPRMVLQLCGTSRMPCWWEWT